MFMSKILYSQSKQTTYGYPRSDNEPIIDLDPDFLILTKIDVNPPEITENQVLSSSYVVDLDNLEYRQEWIIAEKPPEPDWDVFNGTVFANDRFNQVFSQAINIRPLLAVSLPTAMDQVTTKGLTLFASLYGAVCALGGATAEDKLEWGQLARNANLPQDFISIVEGI